jgi:ribonuclease HII
MKLIIGVDEVGRGPLAGPITLAAFAAEGKLKNKLVKILGGKIKDSKQFSPARREEIYKELKKLKKLNKISFFVSHISNQIIDKRGLTYATNLGIRRCLKKLQHKNSTNKGAPCRVRLDGLLKAPKEYKNQKTIIGGDSKDIFIACASIVAKVRRDRLMRRLSKKFPQYSFQIHKGYGTALHYKLLKKHGLSDLHRKSFCSNIKSW